MDILILTDYKGFFGSKQHTKIYRGGMDIQKIVRLLEKKSFLVEVMTFSSLNAEHQRVLKQKPIILYQSSEDKNDHYKSFIKDIIYNLEQSGLTVIPKYSYLAAHNNKVSMELLRQRTNSEGVNTINSWVFGTFEELKHNIDTITLPSVIKPASGAMSKGVSLAKSKKELLKLAKNISSTKNLWHDIKEHLRELKYYKKYTKESFHRSKFIVQNLIPELKNDWKVLVYGNKCFVLYRGVRKNDFRASGSGNFEFRKEIPDGLLDFALELKDIFHVPHISLDIAFDGKVFHLIEFQFLFFGTTTLEKAKFHFEKIQNNWSLIEKVADLEDVYTDSIINFIK